MDLYRIGLKETNVACEVSKGDLVSILVHSKKEETIGIVIEVFNDKICLFTNCGQKKWYSRYVNCEVVAYNNPTIN